VLGWLLVILFGPPLWLPGEVLFEWVGEIIPDESVASVVCGVVALLFLVSGYIILSMLLRDYLHPHFY
jgi:hypothetical protein